MIRATTFHASMGALKRAGLPIVLLLLAGPSLAQEKLAGSNVDVRTRLAFKAPETAVRKMLPDGWEVNSPTTGPAQGANLTLVLIDQTVSQDAEGKALNPLRGAALTIPARKTGSETTATMVVAGLVEPHGAPGAYGVYTPAKAVTERRQSTGADGRTSIEESWDFKGADGSSIEVQLRYERGTPARSKTESRSYSGARPDYYRIYRVDAANDVVRSTATRVDRISKISFKASGPKLAALFDGTEELINVTSVPLYSRQVFLPGP